jgi:8-oxo-dGTP diphosphatase
MAGKTIHAAGGIVVRDGARPRIAVVQRSKDGRWVLPRGKLKRDEPPRDGAKREVIEETGHRVEVFEFLGAITYTARGQSKGVLFWRMKAKAKPSHDLMKDISAVEWLTLAAAIRRLSFSLERLFLHQVGRQVLKMHRGRRRKFRVRKARAGKAKTRVARLARKPRSTAKVRKSATTKTRNRKTVTAKKPARRRKPRVLRKIVLRRVTSRSPVQKPDRAKQTPMPARTIVKPETVAALPQIPAPQAAESGGLLRRMLGQLTP